VVIDHNNEETVQAVLDRGYWAGFTIYPKTKMGKERMAAVVGRYGSERIIVDSSADWGVSDPLAVPRCAAVMRERGLDEALIEAACYRNALLAYGPSGQFAEADWLGGVAIDQRRLFEGSTVLRGQQALVSDGAGDGG
jgi:predicted metal-dependent TIM-barrel fold hydrolase